MALGVSIAIDKSLTTCKSSREMSTCPDQVEGDRIVGAQEKGPCYKCIIGRVDEGWCSDSIGGESRSRWGKFQHWLGEKKGKNREYGVEFYFSLRIERFALEL